MNGNIKNIIESNLNGYTLEKIILFGSRARGDNDTDSDYDIYIVLKEILERNQKVKLMDLLLGKLAEEDICADIVIGNKESIKENENNSDSIVRHAIEEGHII